MRSQTNYTGYVENNITQVTFRDVETTEPTATAVEYLDSSDSTLTDVEAGTPGFQVNLDSVGEHTVKIKVTAPDGMTTQTYTIIITRYGPPGAPVLTAAAKTESIELEWTVEDHGTSDITTFEYRIKESTDANYPTTNEWTTIGTASNTGGSGTIGSLTNGTAYNVQVRGVSTHGNGDNSNEITATPDLPPVVSSVAITSDPGTDKTYIIGEDIVVTFTFDKNITLSGTGPDPYITLNIGTEKLDVGCEVGTAPTKDLVCTHTVYESLEDSDGVDVEGSSLGELGKRIVGPLGQNANLSFSGLAADSDHKVDGVKPTLSSANASGDFSKVVLTFSEAIGTVDNTKITVKKGGTDQPTTGAAIDSTDSTKVEITLMTALLSTDTNITVDLAADAVTDVPGNGNAEDLATAVSLVDNTPPTLSSVGTYAIGGTGTGIALQFNETIASTSIPATSAFAAKIAGTAVGVTSVTRDTDDTDTVNLVLNANPKAGDSVTVAYTTPGSNPLEDEAGNDVASFTDEDVTNNAAAPGKPTVTVAAKDASLEVTVAFTAHGTHNITKYQYQVKTTGSFGTWTDSTENVSNTGGTFTIGSLTNGTAHTVKVRGVSAAGNGAASDEADAARPMRRRQITSIAITSDPGTDKTYIIGDDIDVTLTFDKNITLSGTGADPYIEGNIGTKDIELACTVGTAHQRRTSVCTHTVVRRRGRQRRRRRPQRQA